MKKILFILTALSLFVLLFSHPAVIASGCTIGLTLWYSAVLPSLLPFLIFSGLLIRTGLFHYLNRIYAPVFRGIFRISEEGCYAVLLGFLCGFPMGAKVIADLVRERHISAEEGAYLLGFCNNVSPSFFLNYICILKLGYTEIPWKLVLLFYGLPITYGLITRPFYHFETNIPSGSFPASSQSAKKQTSLQRLDFPMLDACIMDSFSTITRLGGYIIIFAIFVQLLKLLPLSNEALAFLSAVMEISCGADLVSSLPVRSSVFRTALVCTGAAFGGLCICAQTQSVLDGTPLHIRTWLTGRIMIALLVLLLVQIPTVVPALHGCW